MEAVQSSALDDNNSYIIENILNHEIIGLKVNSLNLLIKWHGYKDPTWTSLNISLKRNEAVQEYLKLHDLTKFGLKEKINEDNEPKKKRVRFSTSVKND